MKNAHEETHDTDDARLAVATFDDARAIARGRKAAGGHDDQGRLPGFWLIDKMPYVPIAFLGLALYRAWIELVFVGSFIPFPFEVEPVHDAFDLAMVATLFAGAALARKIEPLYQRSVAYVACGVLMCAATTMAFTALFQPQLAYALALPASVFGGVGTAIVILLWSELYSCLPPYNVALYYCAAIVAAALLLYLCRGLSLPWNAAMAMLLPLASLACASIGFISLAPDERPRAAAARFSFPWKPTLLMAIYAFAFSLHETAQYATGFGPHSALGTLTIGIALFLVIFLRRNDFDFSLLYRVALPLMVGAFVVLPAFGTLSAGVSSFCAMAGYTAFSVLIMIILANMSYRYGMSAVWLFGIERGVRALFTIVGRQVAGVISALSLGGNESLVLGTITVLLVVLGTVLFVSERDFSGRWGVSFKGTPTIEQRAQLRQEDIDVRCRDLAASFGLTERETEVLLLLARGKTTGQVERALVISKDTVKTHVKHIYRKMNIHSRSELADLIGVAEL